MTYAISISEIGDMTIDDVEEFLPLVWRKTFFLDIVQTLSFRLPGICVWVLCDVGNFQLFFGVSLNIHTFASLGHKIEFKYFRLSSSFTNILRHSLYRFKLRCERLRLADTFWMQEKLFVPTHMINNLSSPHQQPFRPLCTTRLDRTNNKTTPEHSSDSHKKYINLSSHSLSRRW